jgi:hypothetical protein
MDRLEVSEVLSVLRCTKSGLATKLGINRAAVYQWGPYVPQSRLNQIKRMMRFHQIKLSAAIGYAPVTLGTVSVTINLQQKTPAERSGVFASE